MAIKLFDSELKVMDILWKAGDMSAKKLAEVLSEQVGWSKTTTYTVIKKCLDKDAIARTEPGFICRALISQEAAQTYETDELIDKLYDGSPDLLVASLLSRKTLTQPEIAKLRTLVDSLK